MNGFIDIRDERGLLLFRYHPIQGVVEVSVRCYDEVTRRHAKKWKRAKLPQPPAVVAEAEQVDSEAATVV